MSESELSNYIDPLRGEKDVVRGKYETTYLVRDVYELIVTVKPHLDLWNYQFTSVDGDITYGATKDIEVLRNLLNEHTQS